MAEKSLDKAKTLAYSNYKEMAQAIAEIGVTVNCAPGLDFPSEECHEFLLNRIYAKDVNIISDITLSVCEGLLSQGVTPVMKHIPGHGRANVDTHYDLPVVDASLDVLKATDFATFRNIANSRFSEALWAMSAHVVYSAVDANNPATFSNKVIEEVIRKDIGFNGVLIADCVNMGAINKGTIEERLSRAAEAGIDMVLFSNSMLDDNKIICESIDEREKALRAAVNISEDAAIRIIRAEVLRKEFREKE